MNLILLGAPGSGKGTLAAKLKSLYPIIHISTGDIFRRNIQEQTTLGMEAATFIKEGKLVPDSITIGMVKAELQDPKFKNGFVFDGFPRTIAQARALKEMLKELDLPLDTVLQLNIEDQTIKDRLAGRRVCLKCGATYNIPFIQPKIENICDVCQSEIVRREDDNPDTVEKRLNTYHEQTKPLIDYYKKEGLLVTIELENSEKTAIEQMDEIFAGKI